MSGSLRAAELLVAGALFCCTTTAQAGVTPWEPIEIRDGQILFPVEIAGHAGRALFDTGASGNSVSRGFVEKAGLELKGRRYAIEGAGSTDEYVPSISRLPIKLFGAEFRLPEVPAVRLETGAELILSAGFLRLGVLQIDYPNSRMRLITRDSVDLAKVANVPLRMEETSQRPAVELIVDGKPRWMLLDTGNAGAILMRRLVAEEGDWIARFKRVESAFQDANADVTGVDLLVLPSVKIGPFELEDVPVAVPAPGEEINISGERHAGPAYGSRIRSGVRVTGIVGYDVLRHFVVTIDYERQKMHVALPEEVAAKPAQLDAAAGTKP
jgi:hypothetical protein